MISNGIQGEYIARIFEEVKGRPLYVVGQTFGFAEALKGEVPEAPAEPKPEAAAKAKLPPPKPPVAGREAS